MGTLLESRHPLSFVDVAPGHHRVEIEVETNVGKDVYDLGVITVEDRKRVYWVPFIPQRLRTTLGGEIELLGYGLEPAIGQVGKELAVTLYWRPLTQPTGNYKVFTHLMNGQGELVAQRDDLPLGGLVLTSQWSPREVLTDHYSILIPADLAGGTYQLEVGMYRMESGERLGAIDASGNRWLNDKIVLQQVEIQPQ
jgi:hypothetical protein